VSNVDGPQTSDVRYSPAMTELRRGLSLLASVVLVGGCASHATVGAPASPVGPTPVAACVSMDEQRSGGVRLPGDHGTPVDAVLLGTGTTGVVLANQSDGDLCQWKSTYAGHLVDLGYRVAVFNYSGQTPDKDVAAVTGALRHRGATRVFLMGASMGGTAVLGAASRVDPAVVGVISISGPQAWAGVNALAAAPAVTVPALFIAAEYDQPFADDARALYQACGAHDKKLSIEPGGNHGTALLSDRVSALVDTFLKAH
jgi:pimeloyl-ACP methyl ester carboxylesterase